MVQSNIVPDGFKNNAEALKGTADGQSASELSTSQNTDIQGDDTKGTQLNSKANQLKNKADTLHTAASQLEQAAQSQSPLQPLLSDAGDLKDAAKKTGSNDTESLHHHANQLANKAGQTGQAADTEANDVIQAFEKVDTQYEALMKLAEDNKLTNHEKVTDVVKAFYAVKNTYYQMFITYRIKKIEKAEIGAGKGDGKILDKANQLYSAANKLADADGLKAQDQVQGDTTQEQLKTQLRDLATALATAVGQDIGHGLQLALSQLNSANADEQIDTKALEVINKYKEVEAAYKKVTSKEKEYNRLVTAGEYTLVKSAFEELEKKFDALKKSIVNVLRLRVQELATLAQALSSKAQTLSGQVTELTTQATQLANAASDSSTQGLKEKADELREAINGPTGDQDGSKAGDVIEQFEAVRTAYDALAKLDKYKQKLSESDQKVQDVDKAYTDLKSLYDKILNFAKVKYYATQVETKAKLISNPDTPKQFEDKLDAFGNVYNSIPADDIKSTVQNDYESIKNVVYGAQLGKMQL